MTRQSFLLSLFVCILVLAAAPALAETLRIVTIALPPYGYVDKGISTGLNYDLANAIAEEAGYTPENIIAPLARTMQDIQTGDADVVIMFPNPTIDAHADNLGLVLPMETVVLGRAGTPLRDIKDLRGKTVATVRGAQYDERISKKNGIILYPTENYAQSLKMLLAERVDAVVGPLLGLYHQAQNDRIPKQALGKPLVLSVARGCLFLSRKASPPDARRKLTEAIRRLTENGTIKALMEKYSL